MSTENTPSAKINSLLDSIDKDVFDCCDALQNAYGTLKHRGLYGMEASEKVEEYLRDWPPTWMRDDTFILSQVPEKIGTDKVRDYIRTLQADNESLKQENKAMRETLEFAAMMLKYESTFDQKEVRYSAFISYAAIHKTLYSPLP